MSVDDEITHAAGESPREVRDLDALLEGFRPRLRRMVSLRLEPRLRRRIDSSDVIQESFVEVTRRLDEYRASPKMPFFVWVRFLTAQKLLELHRSHLDAEKRDVRREVAGPDYPEATSVSLARAIVDHRSSPSETLSRKESRRSLQTALERMTENDREILLLKHFEQLSNAECADILGLSLAGAISRHVRALARLRALVNEHPELSDQLLTKKEESSDSDSQ